MLYTTQLYSNKIVNLFPQAYIEEWLNIEKEVNFKKGELITTPGKLSKHVYLLKQGNAQLFHTHVDGKECVIALLSPGDFIDLLDIFTQKDSSVFAKALTDVTVVAVPKEKIKKIVEQNPELAMELLNHFSHRLQEMVEILVQVAYGKVEERLIFLFKKLADVNIEEFGWHPLSITITHQDLAGMVASTRETVTLLINKLTQLGIIRQKDNRIWIRLEENN